MDAWSLIKAGRFAEAVARYSEKLASEPDGPNFSNRAIAYLNQGDLDAALADFRRAEESRAGRPAGDGYPIKEGAVVWLMGREKEAADIWSGLVDKHNAGQIVYSDASGGVQCGALIWFASCHPVGADRRPAAIRFLKNCCRSKRIASWPGAVGPFLLDKLSEDDLLTAAKRTTSSVLAGRQLCQAHFYAGAKAFERMDLPQFRDHMLKAAEFGSETRLEMEGYLAQREAKR